MSEIITGIKNQIEDELKDYFTSNVNISEDYDFSQQKLIRRIGLFENQIYPTGKFDSQGNYKFWFDIITPRIDSEVKNIDFDTKNIEVYSPRKIDALPAIITNLKVKEWLREQGQAEELNSSIEEGSGWGNIVWKKVKGGYERVDLKNFYVINQSARKLDETPVIERHQLSQSDLRAKSGVWENIDKVIGELGEDSYKSTAETIAKETTTPYYEIYERNGEVSLWDLKQAKGETTTDKDRDEYVLARVIVAGVKENDSINVKYVLFADKLTKSPYKEYHRSRYKGRWFREGLYELLFDLQVRANQIGNQIAQGLEWSSKIIFSSPDKLVVQNILTDLKNGDIVRTSGLAHVPVRIDGFDQLVADWNKIIQLANEIANSREIVQGGDLPAGTPFRLGALFNQNANKLFNFIREKLAIPISEIFEEWIIPDLVKDMKGKEILRLTGDSDMLVRLQQVIVDQWYLDNLINLPPHTNEIAETIKAQQMSELRKSPEMLIKGFKELFDGFHPHISVVITGENVSLDSDLQTMGAFASLEADPVRRSAILELMAKKKGLDFGILPKSTGTLSPPSPIDVGADTPIGEEVVV